MKYFRKQLGSQLWEETDEQTVKDDLFVMIGVEFDSLNGMPFEVRLGFNPDRSYQARSELETINE